MEELETVQTLYNEKSSEVTVDTQVEEREKKVREKSYHFRKTVSTTSVAVSKKKIK